MFATYIKVYGHRIYRMALHLACYDTDLADDLAQEGRIAVWRFDPARVRNNESAIVMRVARDAMLKWLRREKRAQIIAPIQSALPARRQQHPATEQKIVPIRPFAPRHINAVPASDRLAA